MSSEVVIAIYRPKPGRDDELRRLVDRHLPTLRHLGLVTERPAVLMAADDGSLVEIFEWLNGDAARRAHEEPSVAELWDAMENVAEFGTLADLPEATRRFPHFKAL